MNRKLYQQGGYSTEGYRKDSPDRYNTHNIIPSGRVSMANVEFPIHAMDNLGNSRILYPGDEYQFPGNKVIETPVNMNKKMKMGGSAEGHPGMFWNGSKWISSADGATY